MKQNGGNIGCVLMAAGNATRFGTNKLEEIYDGRTLFMRALDVIPPGLFCRVVVVSQYAQLLQQAQDAGFTPYKNSNPAAGISHTIQLGLRALPKADAVLFLVADQPLLRRDSVAKVVSLYRANPEHIVAFAYEECRGNPCIFPKSFFPQLFALSGDTGGRALIRQNEDKLLLCPAENKWELFDVDRAEELKKLAEK